MSEKPTRRDSAVAADRRHAFSLLSPEHRRVLGGVDAEASAYFSEGLEPDEIIKIIKGNHPESIEALDALLKIP